MSGWCAPSHWKLVSSHYIFLHRDNQKIKVHEMMSGCEQWTNDQSYCNGLIIHVITHRINRTSDDPLQLSLVEFKQISLTTLSLLSVRDCQKSPVVLQFKHCTVMTPPAKRPETTSAAKRHHTNKLNWIEGELFWCLSVCYERLCQCSFICLFI